MSPDTVLAQPSVVERDGRVVIVIPMHFKRRGGRKEIIMPPGGPQGGAADSRHSPVQKPLAVAVARAHRWKDLLAKGVFATMNELADRLELDRAYIRRLMNLTLLAPDLVEAILRGDEPSGLSLTTLVETIPVGWEEQRRVFGGVW